MLRRGCARCFFFGFEKVPLALQREKGDNVGGGEVGIADTGMLTPREREGGPKASRYTNLCRAAAAAPWLWFLKPGDSMRTLDIAVGKYERPLADSPHAAGPRTQTWFSLRHDGLLLKESVFPEIPPVALGGSGVDTEAPDTFLRIRKTAGSRRVRYKLRRRGCATAGMCVS